MSNTFKTLPFRIARRRYATIPDTLVVRKRLPSKTIFNIMRNHHDDPELEGMVVKTIRDAHCEPLGMVLGRIHGSPKHWDNDVTILNHTTGCDETVKIVSQHIQHYRLLCAGSFWCGGTRCEAIVFGFTLNNRRVHAVGLFQGSMFMVALMCFGEQQYVFESHCSVSPRHRALLKTYAKTAGDKGFCSANHRQYGARAKINQQMRNVSKTLSRMSVERAVQVCDELVETSIM